MRFHPQANVAAALASAASGPAKGMIFNRTVCAIATAAMLLPAFGGAANASTQQELPTTGAVELIYGLPKVELDAPLVDVDGLPLDEADLDSRAGLPLIVVIVVRGSVRVIVTSCTKSSTCASTAASLAKKAGGAILMTFVGNAARNAFCSSSLGKKYGARVC